MWLVEDRHALQTVVILSAPPPDGLRLNFYRHSAQECAEHSDKTCRRIQWKPSRPSWTGWCAFVLVALMKWLEDWCHSWWHVHLSLLQKVQYITSVRAAGHIYGLYLYNINCISQIYDHQVLTSLCFVKSLHMIQTITKKLKSFYFREQM